MEEVGVRWAPGEGTYANGIMVQLFPQLNKRLMYGNFLI